VERLLEVLRKVIERMEQYSEDLRKSEALTRYSLIDPVIRALGWDTEDPSQVYPEFPTESGRPDYALIFEGKPLIMIEAKSLGSNLDSAIHKGFDYCWRNKVPFYVITDGNRWVIYNLQIMGGEKIGRADLKDDGPGPTARTLLALWRPAMPRVEVPESPVLLEHVGPQSEFTKQKLPPGHKTGTAFNTVTLRDAYKRASKNLTPKAIIFPDGDKRPLRSWRDVLLQTVDWLGSKLESKAPIPCGPRTEHPLVAKNSKGMRAYRKVGPLFVEVHFSAKDVVKHTVWLLEKLEEDPTRVIIEI